MKSAKPQKKSHHQDEEIINDDRFKKVFSDPRFMRVPSKVKKVEIDNRFKSVLSDKKFNVVSKVDKYGRKVKKQDNTMKKFYKLQQEEPIDEEQQEKQSVENEQSHEVEETIEDKSKKYYDEEGNFKWNAESSSSSSSDEDSEESEEESSQDQVEEDVWSDKEKQDVEAKESVEIGKRLALTNMDWDNISAVDILALFNSLCKGDMMITKVEIYPSLFGLEQMEKDTLYGPSSDIFDIDPNQQIKVQKKEQDYEFMDDDEIEGEGFNQTKLRKYEKSKMKYFYAVIHCNSKKTAKQIFNEYNDYEFELSNIRLNLSFIADSLEFPQKPKEVATEVQPDYDFKAANTLNKAMNHTKVKLTWDQTDPKRIQKFQKIMEKDEVDEDDFKEFLGGSSEEEEVEDLEDEEAQKKIEEYRNKLLGGLKSGGDMSSVFRKRDLHERASGQDEELDIKFNVGFGEDIGKKILEEKAEIKEKNQETPWEKYQQKRKDKHKMKKEQNKSKKEAQKKLSKMNPETLETIEDKKKRAELELLVGDGKMGVSVDFKPNAKDRRFQAILSNKDFALDPTHKEFKKVADGEFVKSQQNKRRKLHNE